MFAIYQKVVPGCTMKKLHLKALSDTLLKDSIEVNEELGEQRYFTTCEHFSIEND